MTLREGDTPILTDAASVTVWLAADGTIWHQGPSGERVTELAEEVLRLREKCRDATRYKLDAMAEAQMTAQENARLEAEREAQGTECARLRRYLEYCADCTLKIPGKSGRVHYRVRRGFGGNYSVFEVTPAYSEFEESWIALDESGEWSEEAEDEEPFETLYAALTALDAALAKEER